MKKIPLLLSFLLLLGTLAGAQDIPPRPSPPRLVNDLANQLNPSEEAALEQKLVAYNDSTSTQITVVIVSSVEPYPMADYAFKLGREWGVGQEDRDNGIVLLWAPDDRKVFIATGYGMEGVIPDAIAKRIVTQEILPEFRNKMFYRGLDRGVDAIIRYAAGEYQADPRAASEEGLPAGFLILLFLIILFIILRNRGGGGGRGGRRFRKTGGPVFFPYSTHSSWGSSSGNWGGGGGFGGGGGSFGGFGGGSFGGGGAGGSY